MTTDQARSVIQFLKENLTIRVEDCSRGQNYEVPGSLGVQVFLMLRNPETGEQEVISQSETSIG